jgi:hypothetical protein
MQAAPTKAALAVPAYKLSFSFEPQLDDPEMLASMKAKSLQHAMEADVNGEVDKLMSPARQVRTPFSRLGYIVRTVVCANTMLTGRRTSLWAHDQQVHYPNQTDTDTDTQGCVLRSILGQKSALPKLLINTIVLYAYSVFNAYFTELNVPNDRMTHPC